MLPLVLTAALSAQAPTTAVIVWGGGKTRADAEAWLKAFAPAVAPVAGLYTLKAGYPRVVESKAMKGMKPGFHVVVLGVCRAAELPPRLKLFKAVYAGVYARKVKEAEACPDVAVGVRVEHSQSLTVGDTVLTLSQLDTPKGEVLRATHMSKQGAFLASEGFDTPRPTATACLGGFRKAEGTFEVTLCESTKEKNICCAARKVTTLSVVDGKLSQFSGAVQRTQEDAMERECSQMPIEGGFVLEECADGEIEHGGEGFVEKTMSASLRVMRDGKELKRIGLGDWSNGWEWGTRWGVAGVVSLGGSRRAAIITREDFNELPGLDGHAASAFAYDTELSELWSVAANEVTVTVADGKLSVRTRNAVGGEPEHEDVDEESYTVVVKNGRLERK